MKRKPTEKRATELRWMLSLLRPRLTALIGAKCSLEKEIIELENAISEINRTLNE